MRVCSPTRGCSTTGGARAQRQASGRGRCAGPGIAVRPRAHRARPAGGRGTGPWRRGRAGAGAGGGPGAVSHHHQCARVGARGRAFGAGVSSRAAASRRRAGGDPGRRPGRARSCREGARLRGARRPLRASGDRAAQGVRGIPRRGWGVSRDRELVAGLDLGSTKTCAVIAEVVGDLPRMPLEVEMYLVTVQATAAQNLRKAVQRAGYRVLDLVLEPLAASYAVLTEDEKELGVALLEVGGGSTGVIIFHEGKIRHLASLKYAGAQVTTDVVQVLGVTQADAERLKERHGVAYKPLVDPSEMITLPSTPGQGARQAAREMLSDIIHQRLDEIFHLVDREFEKAGYGGGRLPAGVVLTGGTAHLPGMVELARDVFAMPVRAGAPEQGISGLVDSVQAPRYAVPVGLVLYAARKV